MHGQQQQALTLIRDGEAQRLEGGGVRSDWLHRCRVLGSTRHRALRRNSDVDGQTVIGHGRSVAKKDLVLGCVDSAGCGMHHASARKPSQLG